MKKLLLIIPLIALSGCSTFSHQEKKAPCGGKSAGLFSNPCNPLPINVASISALKKEV